MDFSGKKFIYFDSNEIVLNNILWGLVEMGIDVERSSVISDLIRINDESVERIYKEVQSYDVAITQNFNVNVAEACHMAGVIYISWIYDSPQVPLFTKYALYPENYIFSFDKMQCSRLKDLGIQNIFYRPLAANIARTSAINISDDDIRKYATDISFVGKMYRVGDYEKFIKFMPPELKNEFDELCQKLSLKWDKGYSVFNSFSPEFFGKIRGYLKEEQFSYFNIDPQFISEVYLLGPALAQIERCTLLNAASSLYKTSLYTIEDDIDFARERTGAKVYPPVREEEPYKVYYSSKINLNITLRTIETGVPQRIFDIMSVGGFVLTNYQEEIEELFDIDKEIVVFHSVDEFMDKAKYYLTHNNERIRIGINGYNRTKNDYNYVTSLKDMFSKI